MRTDLMLTGNDLTINNNDLILTDSDDQHIADTINAWPGWWKENPTDGVKIMAYLKGRNIQQELSRSMKIQLQTDGYNSRPIITQTNNNLTVDPNVNS